LTGLCDLAILAIVKTATITEAKNGLSALIDRVRAGESVVITDRGIPVAVLEPAPKQVDIEERLARLERAGLIRRGQGGPPLELILQPGPRLKDGASAVEALLEERRSSER
jgi:prevent-host-death family protein